MISTSFAQRFLKLITLFSVALLISNNTSASAIRSAGITYKSVGSGRFYLETFVIRDCAALQSNPWPNQVLQAMCTSNSSVGWTTHTINHLAFVAPTNAAHLGPYSRIDANHVGSGYYAEEITAACDKVLNPAKFPNSQCRGRGNTVQGFVRIKFSAIITLSSCNSWRLGFSPVCFRNTGSSNTSSGGIYVQTYLNTRDYPNNRSPAFSDENFPDIRACNGYNMSYAAGAHDFDGDSLTYELTCAMKDSSSCIAYRTGYSASLPIQGIRMDSITGLITYRPTSAGKRVINYWVKEYDRCSKKLKAKTLRDIHVYVETCSNKLPYVSNKFSNPTGNFTRNTNGVISVKEGETISWSEIVTDSNNTPMVYLKSNLREVLPGATYTVTKSGLNEHTVRYTWTARFGKSNRKFLSTFFIDDWCDIVGHSATITEFNVRKSAKITRSNKQYNPNLATNDSGKICLGDTVYLEALGSNKYTWRSLSGDSLKTGINWFVDTNAGKDTNKYARLIISQNTIIEVVAAQSVDCGTTFGSSIDTIELVVAEKFGLTIKADSVFCIGDSLILEAITDSSFNYTYNWNSLETLSRLDTVFAGVKPSKKFNASVSVTSDSGCVRNAEVEVLAHEYIVRPYFEGLDDSLCPNGIKPIELTYIRSYDCGLAAKDQNPKTIVTNDTSSASSTGTSHQGSSSKFWPHVFPTGQSCSRNQYLFNNTELKKMSMPNGGKISSVSFYVDSLPTIGDTLEIGIRLGCTSATKFNTGQYFNNLNNAYALKRYTVVLGWNKLVFDSAYTVDKVSSLVMEVITLGNSSGRSPSIKYKTVAYQSSVAGYGTSTNCHGTQFLSLASNSRLPILRFEVNKLANDSSYKYKWLPSNLFTDTTNKKTSVSSLKNTNYQIEITDSSSGCKLLVDVPIYVKNHPTITITNDTFHCKGDQIILNSKLSKAHVSGKYNWYPDTIIMADTIKNPVYTVDSNRIIKVIYSDSLGCSSEDSVLIGIHPRTPTPLLTPSFLCKEDSVVLLRSVSGTGLFFGPGIRLNTNLLDLKSKLIKTTYNFVDSINLQFIDTASICSTDTFFKLPILPLFDVVLSTPSAYCENSGKQQIHTRHTGKGSWSGSYISSSGEFDVNAAGLGVHSIKVDSVGKCGNSGSFKILVGPNPVVSFQTKDYCAVQDCNNVFDTLSGTPSGGRWFGNTWLSGQNAVGQVKICDLSPQVYKVKYQFTDSIGCMDTLTKTFEVFPYPALSFSSNDYCTGPDCDKQMETLSANIPGGEWVGAIWNSGIDSTGVFDVCELKKGSYPIQYRFISNKGCEGWARDTISVDTHNIKVSMLPNYTYCKQGSIELIANKDTALNYLWSVGDTTNKIEVSGGKTGLYSVTVTHPDKPLCFATKSTEVKYDLLCLGVNEIKESKIKLYPNPANGILNLELGDKNSHPVTVHIIDANGALISSEEVNSKTAEFNTINFSEGVYFIEIVNQQRSTYLRFVVRH